MAVDSSVARKIVVIVNPISGPGGSSRDLPKAVQARDWFDARRLPADVLVTEGPGHARVLAASASAAGASLVVAWGGDGTVNEVGSALAFGPAALGIVPSGSGNGLARELGIPLTPAVALARLIDGEDRVIDAGELDGHLFFNVAGFGLDARVAKAFGTGSRRRGLRRYLGLTARELATFVAEPYRIAVNGVVVETLPLLVAFANARQYGNGALIAPSARVDDGRLDLVVVEHRSVLAIVCAVPHLFAGSIARVAGVRSWSIAGAEVWATGPILYHVDGEPHVGADRIQACVRARAVRVRVPRQPTKR